MNRGRNELDAGNNARIASTVERLMEARGLSPEGLAAASGLHKTTVYRILAGRTAAPRRGTLRGIARAFGISVSELVRPGQLPLDPSWATGPDPGLGSDAREEAILAELRRLPGWLRLDGAKAVLLTFVDVSLGVVPRDPRLDYVKLTRGTGPENSRIGPVERIIRHQWQGIPSTDRSMAAEAAVRSLVALRLAAGSPPSSDLYAPLTNLRRERAKELRSQRRSVRRSRSPSSAGNEAESP